MRSPSPPKTVTQNSPQIATSRMGTGADQLEDSLFADSPSRPRAYSRPNRQTGPPPTAYPGTGHLASPQSSHGVKPIAEHVSERDDSAFDTSLLDSAALATRYQETKKVTPQKKVMTPQQFELYRRQQDERHRYNQAFGKADSDESGDDYDDEDEDEMERDRQAQNQRKKQEAHLAVYRQTMIKITGEAAPGPIHPSNGSSSMLSPSGGMGASTHDLSNRLSAINLDTSSGSKSPGRSSDGDEDDDVPLGILAAHGFPNKNRPPTRLMHSGSNSNLRGGAQSLAPPSVTGDAINRNSLPAFARKLPEDPYYGAGLVHAPQRESMAFHSYSSPNLPTLAVPSGASTNHPHHPAGLVGVIAGEERARAARRGSPGAANGAYELPPSMQQQPGMMRSHTMGQMPPMMMPGMPGMPPMPMMPGMPPMMTQGEHAQIQMSQQMTQMMQMQMQWMQQMQQFMSGAGGPATGPADNTSVNGPRPQSVPLQNYAGPAGRTMSTLDPSMANWNLQPPTLPPIRPNSSYAPSIAPSERSNIGLASRYRPVSTIQEPAGEPAWQKRSSTMTSSTFRPWSTFGAPKATAAAAAAPSARKSVMPVDDDDDEAGWAEMKAKKEKKQRTWKLRKGTNPLQELYNGSS